VVDDQQENRTTMARMLEAEGHTVGFAGNGREALEALRRDDYDLVLLDILMPEMNGLQVLRELRRLGLLRHTPVIVVSGWDDRGNIIRCITAGAEDFISRPVDLRLLRARVDGCLERKRLRQRHFEQFFTPELARHFVRNPELLDRARSAEVSLLFADVRGFSSVSERLGPGPLCEWLQDVLEVLSDCVIEHDGVLVDYIGDEIIAMWGAPGEQPDHALLACRAGRAMLARLPEIDARWRERIGGLTQIGVGVSTGEAFVGNIGTARKLKYSALGNTVNLASRTQGATKYFRCTMLVTGDTHIRLGGALPTRRLGRVRVANIETPVEMFQVAPPDVAGWEQLRDPYEQALAAFEAGRFDDAISGLGRLLQDCPGDMPSLRLIRRAGEARYEPAAAFDPVLVLPGK
jgi:adenylate cyclase